MLGNQDVLARLATLEARLAHNQSVRLKPPEPEHYTGDDGRVSIDTWLFKLERFFKLTETTSDIKRVDYAAALLRGRAALWYRLQCLRAASVDDTPYHTWDEFTHAVKEQFATVNHEKRARDRLAALRQTTSVRRYLMEFSGLCLEISDMSSAEKMDRFLRGLKPAIRKELELRGTETFEEAMSLAERLDNLDFAYRGNNRSNGPRTGASFGRASHHTGPVPMELGNIQHTFGAARTKQPASPRRTKLTWEERKHLLDNGGCLYCRRMGHSIEQCPAKPSRPPYPPPKNGQWRTHRGSA